MLENTHKLAEENNEILRSIRRSNRFSTAMKIAYWVLIIGLSVGAYYLIQPYMTFLSGLSGGQSLNLNNAQNAADQLKDLLK